MNKKKEKNNKKLLKIVSIILVSIIVLVLILFSIIYFVILSPKKNFDGLFNTLFDNTIKVINKGSIDSSSTSINKGNIKIDTNINKYKILKDYEIEYDIEHNRKDKKTFIDLTLGDNDDEDIKSTFYYEPNTLYVSFPYIISDMIKISLDKYGYKINNEKNILDYSKDDSNYILQIIKNSFMTSYSEKNLSNTITDYHVKSTYKIDRTELESILNNILTNLKKDVNAMKILEQEFLINEDNLNNYKDNILKYFDEKLEFVEINMFTNSLFKFDKLTINTKTYNIELLLDEMNKLTIKSNNKEVITSSFNLESLNMSINKNNKVILIDLKIDTSKDEVNLDGNITLKENDDFIKLEVSIGTLLNEEISEYDVSPAKSFNQFTSKDLKSVYKAIDLINKYIELLTGSKEHIIKLKNS